MEKLDYLFERNAQWAAAVKREDPDFFENLFKQQTPEYLWIGCSDSRVPANNLVNMPPGEVFVHRNIANVVVHTDLNCLSVIQFAVDVLKVKHIIVCGHYGCGGVVAAMDDKEHGLIDNWLRHIEDVARFNADKLENLDHDKMLDTMCELNVIEQVANVCHTSTVQHAWRNRTELAVHGWIYSIKDGILKDLSTTITSNEELGKKQGKR